VRQLHVLGVSDDGQALLLGPSAGKASHRLPLDERLRAAVRGQLSVAGVERAESALTPKEIQARLREGATSEEVAKEAQVPVARVLPYAAPVIAERERIVEQARAAVMHRSRGPGGERPLGEVVDGHLGETAGLKPESVEWTARRRRDGAWIVSLSYAGRGGRRTASWLWRPVERDLTALDSSATRLAAEESGPARRRGAAQRGAARPSKRAAGSRTTKKAARRPGAKKAKKAPASKKSTVKRAVPTKAAPRKAAAKKAPVRKRAAVKKAAPKKAVATRKPAPVKKPSAKKPPVRKAPAAGKAAATRKPAPVKKLTAVARPTVVPDPVVTQAPSPVVVIRPNAEPEPEAVEQVATRRPGQRVPLPSWSDVLLGVAPTDSSREPSARRRRKSG